MIDLRGLRNFYVLGWLVALAACSNGRGSVDTAPPSGGAQEGFTVGGTVNGLQGDGLVLQLNGADNLTLSNDGIFTFTTELADAAAYSVTVADAAVQSLANVHDRQRQRDDRGRQRQQRRRHVRDRRVRVARLGQRARRHRPGPAEQRRRRSRDQRRRRVCVPIADRIGRSIQRHGPDAADRTVPILHCREQ